MSDQITINGQTYKFFRQRYNSPVRVFQGAGTFLRLGPQAILEPEIAFHKKLEALGFPVAKLLAEGETGDNYYFAESSLGEELFGDLFWSDWKGKGVVSEEHFQQFLDVVKKFALAQLKTITTGRNRDSFYKGAHFDDLAAELPDLLADLRRAFEKILEKTQVMPDVLTHGDLGPYNTLKNGIIDFGSHFVGPAGYDLIANFYHTYFFAKDSGQERNRRFEFTPDQKQQYLGSVDEIYQAANLAKPSDLADEYIFCRAVWATAKMGHWPKVQQWRYKKFRKLLTMYLASEPLFNSRTLIS